MKHVQPFSLSFTDEPQPFDMPKDATTLAFDVVDNSAWLFALVDSESKPVKRYFTVIRSQTVPASALYIGTCLYQQSFCHLFETSL
jgi:hypothetical protein